jgi:hypothetical protein
MIFNEKLIYRFAAAESFMDAMPVLDILFAEPPAKIDFLATEECWKIKQTNVEILDETTDLLNLFHGRFKSFAVGLTSGFHGLDSEPVHEHPAGHHDPLQELLERFFSLVMTEFGLHRRPYDPIHNRQKLAGLNEREVAGHQFEVTSSKA